MKMPSNFKEKISLLTEEQRIFGGASDAISAIGFMQSDYEEIYVPI